MSNKIDENNWYEVGANMPAQEPTIPKTSSELDDHFRHTPDFLDRLEITERMAKIDLREARQDDVVAFRTENGQSFIYKIDSNGSSEDSIKGRLFIPLDMAEAMGAPTCLNDVIIKGSSPDGYSSLYTNTIIQGNTIECGVPLSSLGPTIHPKEENYLFDLIIDPVEAAQKKHENQLSAPLMENIEAASDEVAPLNNEFEPNEVTDWPGKSLGIDQEKIDQMLYFAPRHGGGIRLKYTVHPETGIVTKQGKPLNNKDVGVWEVVETYSKDYSLSKKEFSAQRSAAFAWWAMRLGIEPTEKVVRNISECGLPFKVDRDEPEVIESII